MKKEIFLNNEGGDMLENGETQSQGKLEALKELLEPQGWEVKEGDKSQLVEMVEGGVVICVDGRLPKGEYSEKIMRGPKIQGAVEGVALLRAKTQGKSELTKEDVVKACEVVEEAGYTPGVHDLHEEVHCGHCKLLAEGKLTDMPELGITPQEIASIVVDRGGEHIELEGQHTETVVRLNFVEGMTLEPKNEAFNLDGWLAEKLGIDEMVLLGNAVDTVVGLNGPKVLEVIE